MQWMGLCNMSLMLKVYDDVFCTNLGLDPPVKVSELDISPDNNSKSYLSPQHRYALQKSNFIISTIRVGMGCKVRDKGFSENGEGCEDGVSDECKGRGEGIEEGRGGGIGKG